MLPEPRSAGPGHAAENLSFSEALDRFPIVAAHARTMLRRLEAVRPLRKSLTIADVGAAQGLFVIACAQMGHCAIGIEPWQAARKVANELAKYFGAEISIIAGTAEQLPLESGSVDILRANSVIEHVIDAEASFCEAYRVLKPGGMFWFFTASSICPRQGEIRGFPCFSWYPHPLKVRIMRWAAEKRPQLIGHTAMPAVHWFTPRKAHRMLQRAGFLEVYDRWDLRLPSEGGRMYQRALSIIRLNSATKLVGDMFVPSCSYAAVK